VTARRIATLTFITTIFIQIPLLFLAAQNAFDRFNPDAVAYVRIAEYYLDGRLDLAVNGYWGPALSWLIAVLTKVLGDPLIAARAAMAISAVVYLGCATRLYAALDLTAASVRLAVIVTGLATIGLSVQVISPDLLLAAVLSLAVARALTPIEFESRSYALITGLLFGVAYLVKAVALPIGIALLVSISVLRLATSCVSRTKIGLHFAASLVGLLVVAATWISIISIHYQTFTISQSAHLAHAILAPDNPLHQSLIFRSLNIPEQGRVTAWEDPASVPERDWSASSSFTNFVHQMSLVETNIAHMASNLNSNDLTGLGLAGAMLTIFLAGPLTPAVWSARWTLAPAAVILLIWPYLPVYGADARYYWPCFPFLLAGALGLSTWIAAQRFPGSELRNVAFRKWGALAVVGLSFLVPIAMGVTRAVAQPSGVTGFALSKSIVAALADADVNIRAIASVGDDLRVGLFAAFLTSRPWLGNATATDTASDLLRSGANVFVVVAETPLGEALQHEPSIRPIPMPAISGANHIQVFTAEPAHVRD
jgi:hypothetical protein